MKVLKHIVNVTIWLLLALYLTLVFALRFDAVQAYLGTTTAKLLADKLETKVEVGKIDLGLLNRIIIDDVVVYDKQGKEMLTSSRISAKLSLLELAKGNVEISSAQIFGAHFKLYKQSEKEKPNFQFVIDALSSEDKEEETPLNLRINSLIMRRCSFEYDQWDIAETPERLNVSHLSVSDFRSQMILKKLTNDSININIKKMSLKEKSGLVVSRLSLMFEAGRERATLKDFSLKMPNTTIEIEKATAKYKTDDSLHIKEGTISYSGAIKSPQITPADVSCLLPTLKNFNSSLDINIKAHGNDKHCNIDLLQINSSGNEISLNASATLDYERDKKTGFAANIKRLLCNAETIDFIAQNLKGDHVQVPDAVTRLGDVSLSGMVASTQEIRLKAQLNVTTQAGKAYINGRWQNNGFLNGNITTENINLKQILDNEHFGTLSTKMEVNGIMPNIKSPDIDIKGIISNFEYNAYTFNNIYISAHYNNHGVTGNINSNNPSLAFNVDGSLKRESGKQHIELDAQIKNINPKNIHITDIYQNANFSAKISANITGNNINDMVGTIDVNRLKMVSSDDYYSLDNLHIVSGYDDNGHYLNLISDFATININGHYDYASLPTSFINVIKKHLPTMPGLPQKTAVSENNFTIYATITKTDWLQKLIGINLELQQPINLQGKIDDTSKELTLELEGNEFSYSNSPYRNLHLDIASEDEELNADIVLAKVMENGHKVNYKLNATAADNKLTTVLSWTNNHNDNDKMSGKVNAVSQFYTNSNGQQTAKIDIEKSRINIKGALWEVAPANITYSEKHITVNNFSINHDDQYLHINGVASQNINDSLNIDLKDIDVEYVLDIVNFHSVDFNGYASGRACVKTPFGDALYGEANLKVRQFEFEHGRMGTLSATAKWNNNEKQIDIHGICNDGPDAMTFINGYVSPQRNYIDLDIGASGTYIEFMQSFTKSFAENITGKAVGQVKLAGPLSTINLTGKLVVDGEATIKSLNCKYYLQKDTITFIPDEIELRNAPIYDIYNNVGYLNGNIHHKHLTRLSYDLEVNANNLLAYDFTDFGESSFYGTVFATGNVGIHGKSGEVRIDVNCTPEKNSVFTYNASSPDAITDQEFIQWNDITPKDSQQIAQTLGENSINTTSKDDIPTDIYINFLVNCRPDATIRLLMDSQTNDYMTLNGSGVIRATFYNKGAFKMFGTYLIDHGTYGITIQNIIKKNFVINQGGTIVFGGDPYDAALNMQAMYTVNGVSLSDLSANSTFSQRGTTRVNCLMNIGGRPYKPQVTFDLDMPTMDTDEKQMVYALIDTEEEKNQQVLYLLGVGRFYPQAENNAANSGQMSQTSLAMQSLLSGTISGQINALLNNVLQTNNWTFGANISTGDEGWNNAEYEGLINGRMLNNRLLFNGEFGYRDNSKTAQTSFIGDFDIQYLLSPSGNIAMKIYNKTNDRYFTTSSLNTQGVGLIMKRDFTNWRDFWGLDKKKKRK